MAELQEIRKHMQKLDAEIAKNAEYRQQLTTYFNEAKEGEKARKFALQLESADRDREDLRTRQNEQRALEKEILEKLEPTHGGSTSAPGGAGDQQAAPPPPPPPRVGHVGYAVAVALLVLVKKIFRGQCSTATAGCSWWLGDSAEQGASLLLQLLHAVGVWTQLGAHQLVDFAVSRLPLHTLSVATDNGLQQVPFLPAGVRRVVVRTLMECAAAGVAICLHGVLLAMLDMVAALALRVYWRG